VDGGAAASTVLMQAQADSTALEVRRPAHLESTARGVALMAGQEVGVVRDLDAIRQRVVASSSLFEPKLSAEDRQLWRRRWQEAVRRCLHWHGDANV
jgi:glycerol kinase